MNSNNYDPDEFFEDSEIAQNSYGGVNQQLGEQKFNQAVAGSTGQQLQSDELDENDPLLNGAYGGVNAQLGEQKFNEAAAQQDFYNLNKFRTAAPQEVTNVREPEMPTMSDPNVNAQYVDIAGEHVQMGK